MLATKKDLKALEERVEEIVGAVEEKVEKSNKERVEALRDKIFKKTTSCTSDIYAYVVGTFGAEPITPKPLEEDFFDNLERTEKRQELLMKHLGLKFVEVDAVDKHEEIRKVKEPTPETSPRKKTCSKCGEERPITDFYRNKQSKGGRGRKCKFCVSEYMKQYHSKHKTNK